MKMATAIDKVHIGFLLICFFSSGSGQLTITSSDFKCGQSASIVCLGTNGNVTNISWFKNADRLQSCTLTMCRDQILEGYRFSAEGGVWRLTIDRVELKDNNITFKCQTSSSGSKGPVEVSLTIDMSVPIDNSSILSKDEQSIDVIFKAESNCVKPVENVNITWQCVKAEQENAIDSDCRPTTLSTYTSECKDLNQTCAGPGTYRMGGGVKLPAYIGDYFKLVKIKAVFTDGANVIEKISTEVKQEVPPKIAPLRDCSVIENTEISVKCSLSSGDPSTVKCKWYSTDGMVSHNCSLRIRSVQRISSGTYTCRVENGVGNDTQSFSLDIMYAPSVQTFRRQCIIEGSNFSQICNTTPGRPIATNYLWTRRNGQLSENKRVLTITNATPAHADNYTCTAWNILNPSYGILSNGTDQKTFSLEILYPPKLKPIANQSVTEGSSFTQNCELLRYGNPPGKIMWFSLDQAGNDMSIENVNGSLTIVNVSRNRQGWFKCVTENSMKPTDKEMVKGTDFKIFYLNVFYTTSISSLTINDTAEELVVNQNTSGVQFMCNVSSNPLSNISLHSKTQRGFRVLKEDSSSDHLLYSLSTATCWDSGEYTCSGRNNVTENELSKAVKLLVECTARPLHETEQNITFYRRVGDDVSFNLTVVAYPLPASELFQWAREQQKQNITHFNGSIVNLSISSLESSLTLEDIQEADFGQYKLTIKYNNTMDAYVQYFFINAQDRPQMPEDFVHLEEELTPTTAVLKWKSGFNGGVPQVFNILYKKASDSSWSHIIVSNSTLTLTDLDPSTLYNVYMFASNELGNSSKTLILNITTQQATEERQSPNIGAIIRGATGGGSAIVVIAVVVVVVVIFRKKAAEKSGNSWDQIGQNLYPESIDDGHDDSKTKHKYKGMEFNQAYVSTDTLTVPVASGSDNVYAQVDKTKKKGTADTGNTYAVVDKTSKKGAIATGKGNVYATPLKKKQGKNTEANSKQKGKKTKKGKVAKQKGRGDVYVNMQELTVYGNIGQKDETVGNVYKTGEEPPASKRNLNKDGLIYADLAFENNNKGHKKLFIHGVENTTDYVQVDFSKKAEPLHESDDEGGIV